MNEDEKHSFDMVLQGLTGLEDSLMRLKDIVDGFDYEQEDMGVDKNGQTYTERVVGEIDDALADVYTALSDAKTHVAAFRSSNETFAIFNRTIKLVSAGIDPITAMAELYSNLYANTQYSAGARQAVLIAHEELKKDLKDVETYEAFRPPIRLAIDVD